MSFLSEISKYSVFENSLLAESLSNLPFLTLPIKLKFFNGICDFVVKESNLISISFVYFFNGLDLLSFESCLSKCVASYRFPTTSIFSLKEILKLLFSLIPLKVLTSIFKMESISFLLFNFKLFTEIIFLPSINFI